MSLMLETKELFAQLSENRLAVMPGLPELLDLIEARETGQGCCDLITSAVHGVSPAQVRLAETIPSDPDGRGCHAWQTSSRNLPGSRIELNVDPSEMLVLEDSETGSLAAVNAGAVVVSVPSRHTDYGDFSRSHLVVSSLEDAALLDLIR